MSLSHQRIRQCEELVAVFCLSWWRDCHGDTVYNIHCIPYLMNLHFCFPHMLLSHILHLHVRPRVDFAASKHTPPSSSSSSSTASSSSGPTTALVMPSQRSPANLSSASVGTVGSVVNPTGSSVHLPYGLSQVLAQKLLKAAVKRLTGFLGG